MTVFIVCGRHYNDEDDDSSFETMKVFTSRTSAELFAESLRQADEETSDETMFSTFWIEPCELV